MTTLKGENSICNKVSISLQLALPKDNAIGTLNSTYHISIELLKQASSVHLRDESSNGFQRNKKHEEKSSSCSNVWKDVLLLSSN